MKLIQKKLFIATLGIMMLQAPAFADNDHPISFRELPQHARIILKKDFGNHKIKHAEKEIEDHEITYEVKLTNGTSIEFDRKGNWKKIDCERTSVPRQFIPREISTYVRHKWPNATIVKIERNRKHFEVELSNDTEITFDKNFKIVDIDD